MNLRHYLDLLLYHKALVVAIAAGIPALALALSAFWLLALPLYTAQTVINLIPVNAEMRYSEAAAANTDPSMTLVQTHIEYILSRPVAERTLDRLLQDPSYTEQPPASWVDGLVEAYVAPLLRFFSRFYRTFNSGFYSEPSEREELLEELRQSIAVEPIAGSFALVIEVTAQRRKAASALIANTLAEVYVERFREQAAEASSQVIAELEQAIAVKREMLDELDAKSLAIQQDVNVLDPTIESESLIASREIERQNLQNDQAELRAAQSRYAALREDLTKLQTKGLGTEVEQELALSRAKMLAMEDRVKQREETLATYNVATRLLAGNQETLAKVRADRKLVAQEMTVLLDRAIQAKMALATSLSEARIIDPAVIPVYPSAPEVLDYTIIAGIAGIFFAVFVILVIDTLGSTVKTAADLQRVGGAMSLGSFPHRQIEPLVRQRRSLEEQAPSGNASEAMPVAVPDGLRAPHSAALASWIDRAAAAVGAYGNACSPFVVTGFACRDTVAAAAMGIAFVARYRRAPVALVDWPIPEDAKHMPGLVVDGGRLGPHIDRETLSSLGANLILALPPGEVREDELASIRQRWETERGARLFFLLVKGPLARHLQYGRSP